MSFEAEPFASQQTDEGVTIGHEERARTTSEAQRKSVVREILETVILTILIFLVVRAVVQNFKVEGYSMEPTLHTGQYLLVNKAAYFHVSAEGPIGFLPGEEYGKSGEKYLFGGPQRGDIIVFEYPEDPSRDFIKRVIGLPGDRIEIKDNLVYLNGVALAEPYIKEAPEYTMPSAVTVPEDSVFVMGDNRNNSSDSHIWGPLPLSRIVGKGLVSYWPPEDWGLLPHADLSKQIP